MTTAAAARVTDATQVTAVTGLSILSSLALVVRPRSAIVLVSPRMCPAIFDARRNPMRKQTVKNHKQKIQYIKRNQSFHQSYQLKQPRPGF
jgi:hypothetical protein